MVIPINNFSDLHKYNFRYVQMYDGILTSRSSRLFFTPRSLVRMIYIYTSKLKHEAAYPFNVVRNINVFRTKICDKIVKMSN